MRKNKGFTLVELVVVMAIIAVLVALALFAINAARVQSRNTDRRSKVQAFKVALESYFSAHKFYPACGNVSMWLVARGAACGAGAPAVSDFVSDSANFVDPRGDDESVCYIGATATYTLRMSPETLTAWNPALGSCNAGDHAEDYSQS